MALSRADPEILTNGIGMSTIMVDPRRTFWVSDDLKRPK